MPKVDLFKTAADGVIWDYDRYNQDQADVETAINTHDDDIIALQNLINTNETDIENKVNTINNTLTTKANSSDVYTKVEIDPFLRGGDTLIKVEVFTIVNSNLGDGTFSYTNKDAQTVIGTLDVDGGQIFELTEGTYPVNENKIDATINDSLHRDTASGGLSEIDETHIKLTSPEGNGAEITFKYFERIGLTGEHAITHTEGGGDAITVTYNMCNSSLKAKIDKTNEVELLAYMGI